MVEMSGEYLGDLSVESIHEPSGARIVTDAPVDNQGLGRNFSPTDLVATGLGACILTILGIVAARRDLDLRGARYRVRKEMIADPKRRIRSIETTITLPAHLSEKDRAALERAAHGCPIHHTLEGRVEMPIEFVYDETAQNQPIVNP